MRRSIVSAVLFIVAGIFYLIAAMKGNIPLYYIFGILLLLFGGLYIKRAFSEKKVEEKTKSSKLKTVDIKNIKVSEVKKDTNKKKSNNKSSKQK